MGACKDIFIRIQRSKNSFLNIEPISYENCLGIAAHSFYVAAPQAPAGLAVTSAENGQVALDWDALVKTPDSYAVYVEDTSTGTVVQTITGLSSTSHTVTGLTDGTQYEFWATATTGGVEGAESNHVTATPVDTQAPAAPTGLTIGDQRPTEIDISWDANAEADLDGYNVYIDSGAGFSKHNSSLVTPASDPETYTIDGLAESTTYDIKVTAVDDAGNESSDSSVVQGTTTSAAPDAPSNLAESQNVKRNDFSLDFDGVDDNVDMGLAAETDINNGDATWICSFKTPGTGTFRLMDKRGQGAAGGGFPGLQLSGGSDWGNTFLEDDAGNVVGAGDPFGNYSVPQDNQWHTVALRWENDTGTLSLFLDGVLLDDETNAAMIGANCATARSFHVGSANTDGQYFTGFIDEVQVWNVALTNSEIAENAGKELTGAEAGLVGYWRFEEGSGTTAADKTGNNDGAIDGATYADDTPFGTITDVDFTWDAVSGVDGYNLYLSDDGGATYAKQNGSLIAGTTYTIEDIANGEYEAFVKSEESGIESPESNHVTFVVSENTLSVSFDGSGDYVDIPHIPAYNPAGNSFSVMCWFKPPSSAPSNSKGIIFKSPDTSRRRQISLAIQNTSGVISAGTCDGSDTTFYSGSGTTNVCDGLWHHVALTSEYDGTDTVIRVYIDFVEEITLTILGDTQWFNTEKITLGRVASDSDPSRYLAGNIDEVSYWEAVLTQSEVITYANQMLQGNEPNIVGYWNAEDEVAGVFTDLTSNSNNGSIAGAVYSSDAFNFNYSLSFDGVDDYVEVPNSAGLQLGSTFTLEAYIKRDASGENDYIMWKRGTTNNGYAFWITTSDNIRFTVLGVGSFDSSVTVPAGAWHHVAIRVSGGQVTFFLDGVEDNTLSIGSITNNTEPLYVGVRTASGSIDGYSDNLQDDLRVWNTARTNQEIADNLNSELDGSEAGLVANWKLNEGAGTVAEDATANNNDGTINGASYSTDTPF